MKDFWTSLFVADIGKKLHQRRVRVWRKHYVLWMPGHKRMAVELLFGPKVCRPLNVTSEFDILLATLAERVRDDTNGCLNI